MADHIADIPRPMYGYVHNTFLHDFSDPQQTGVYTSALLFGVTALPGRAWGVSALLDNGALVQNLPVTAFTQHLDPILECCHAINDLQVWSCYGHTFSTHEYDALRELPARCYVAGEWVSGRYWFTAAPYDDMYSRTPDQHKHFNFCWLDCGHLVALPGNRMLVVDSSFTINIPKWGERPKYKVNTRYWYPERDEPVFDEVVGPEDA